jgi:putative transposase
VKYIITSAIRAQAASAALHSSVIVALRPSLPVLNCPFLIFSASSIPEIVTTALSNRLNPSIAAFIQRCQVHKKRNVVDHVPDEHKADVKRKLQNAYAMADYVEAKRALDRLHRELMDLNPSAARSLAKGMEETLTVHRLRVPDQLRRTLCCTNVIESAFSIVETVCRNVKRWRTGDQIERWVGSGLLVAERQFRKVIGHRQIPLLLSSMASAVAKKPIAKGAAVA